MQSTRYGKVGFTAEKIRDDKGGVFLRDLPDAMRFADHFFRFLISEYRHMRVSVSARVFFDLCVKECSKQIVILRVCHIFGERCEKNITVTIFDRKYVEKATYL